MRGLQNAALCNVFMYNLTVLTVPSFITDTFPIVRASESYSSDNLALGMRALQAWSRNPYGAFGVKTGVVEPKSPEAAAFALETGICAVILTRGDSGQMSEKVRVTFKASKRLLILIGKVPRIRDDVFVSRKSHIPILHLQQVS